MKHVLAALVLLGVSLATCGRWCFALIDPSFTPVQLVEASRTILAGRLEEDKENDRWLVRRVRALKGKDSEDLLLALALPKADEAEKVREFLHSSIGPEAIFFMGGYEGIESGFLLAGNTWLELKPAGGPLWQITSHADRRLSRTYDGAADKLIEMTDYIVRHDDADVPVSAGVKWQRTLPVGRLAGPASGMFMLPTRAGAASRLFVASPGGDRLFVYDAAKRRFEDVTPMSGLDTTSAAFTFVDLNRDGLPDLVSFDGTNVLIREGLADGRFVHGAKSVKLRHPLTCSSLAPLSPRQDGSPGVLVGAP